MKYLPIQQSVLKVDKKYSYHVYIDNDTKYKFNKFIYIALNLNKEQYHKMYNDEKRFRRLFIKYFHNNIFIDWDK